MSHWQIVYTEQAARGLRGIHEYIADFSAGAGDCE